MTLIFAILTALGLGACAGLRPFLPALVAGALGAADLGIDFDGTDLAFLESAWWLLAVLALLAFVTVVARRRGAEALEAGPLGSALGGIAIGVAGLLGAGAFADDGYTLIGGAALGAGAAVIGQLAARSLFGRVRARLDKEARDTLTLFADGAALIGAAAAIRVPPLSILVLGFLGWLLRGSQRRDGEKFAGLRSLR